MCLLIVVSMTLSASIRQTNDVFASIGEEPSIYEKQYQVLEQFVCEMYGHKDYLFIFYLCIFVQGR